LIRWRGSEDKLWAADDSCAECTVAFH
jgi:hypothetical protein